MTTGDGIYYSSFGHGLAIYGENNYYYQPNTLSLLVILPAPGSPDFWHEGDQRSTVDARQKKCANFNEYEINILS